jgi:hypothetical protein
MPGGRRRRDTFQQRRGVPIGARRHEDTRERRAVVEVLHGVLAHKPRRPLTRRSRKGGPHPIDILRKNRRRRLARLFRDSHLTSGAHDAERHFYASAGEHRAVEHESDFRRERPFKVRVQHRNVSNQFIRRDADGNDFLRRYRVLQGTQGQDGYSCN